MNSKVYVILDTSASFKTDGKDALQNNLLVTLMSATAKDFYIDNNAEAVFLSWNKVLVEIEPLTDEYLPDLTFTSRVNINSILQLVIDSDEGSRFLLLSDGVFDEEETKELQEMLKEKNSYLYCVAVGADADEHTLAAMAYPRKYCYKTENVLTALRELSFRTFLPNKQEETPTLRRRRRR